MPRYGEDRLLATHHPVLLIGFGNMGQALAPRVACEGQGGRVDPGRRHRRGRSRRRGRAHLHASANVAEARAGFDPEIAVLAVKPNQLAAVLDECRPLVERGCVFLSIAAGKTIARLEAGLGPIAAVVRAMPNTPAAVGKGMTALVANAAVRPSSALLCGELLAAVGAVAWLDDERHMDAVTAVSGSGPAYVFLLIECLENAALEAGLLDGTSRGSFRWRPSRVRPPTRKPPPSRRRSCASV